MTPKVAVAVEFDEGRAKELAEGVGAALGDGPL
jgi:hypothetical protein